MPQRIKTVSRLRVTLNQLNAAERDMITTVIPFFLAVRFPTEKGAWRYGPEYIFTVQMNLTRIPESTGIPAISRIACRLHCVPKKQGILSCSLKQGQGFDLSPGERNIVKNVTDQPIELSFNEAGINKIIVSENIPMYDLNILRIVIEQLHTGSDFKNIGDGTFSSIINSDIGRCNTVIEISRFSACTRNTTVNKRRYKLKLLRELHRTADETVIINKKPNLNNCRCYAQQYYRKYGDTVICEHGNITADLMNMVSRMQINGINFMSTTTKTGTIESYNEKYSVMEIITVTLKDIQPAKREIPVIMKPVETKLMVNFEVTSISAE